MHDFLSCDINYVDGTGRSIHHEDLITTDGNRIRVWADKGGVTNSSEVDFFLATIFGGAARIRILDRFRVASLPRDNHRY